MPCGVLQSARGIRAVFHVQPRVEGPHVAQPSSPGAAGHVARGRGRLLCAARAEHVGGQVVGRLDERQLVVGRRSASVCGQGEDVREEHARSRHVEGTRDHGEAAEAEHIRVQHSRKPCIADRVERDTLLADRDERYREILPYAVGRITKVNDVDAVVCHRRGRVCRRQHSGVAPA
eukprot:805424-Prymnesium_polylepis.1